MDGWIEAIVHNPKPLPAPCWERVFSPLLGHQSVIRARLERYLPRWTLWKCAHSWLTRQCWGCVSARLRPTENTVTSSLLLSCLLKSAPLYKVFFLFFFDNCQPLHLRIVFPQKRPSRQTSSLQAPRRNTKSKFKRPIWCIFVSSFLLEAKRLSEKKKKNSEALRANLSSEILASKSTSNLWTAVFCFLFCFCCNFGVTQKSTNDRLYSPHLFIFEVDLIYM